MATNMSREAKINAFISRNAQAVPSTNNSNNNLMNNLNQMQIIQPQYQQVQALPNPSVNFAQHQVTQPYQVLGIPQSPPSGFYQSVPPQQQTQMYTQPNIQSYNQPNIIQNFQPNMQQNFQNVEYARDYHAQGVQYLPTQQIVYVTDPNQIPYSYYDQGHYQLQNITDGYYPHEAYHHNTMVQTGGPAQVSTANQSAPSSLVGRVYSGQTTSGIPSGHNFASSTSTTLATVAGNRTGSLSDNMTYRTDETLRVNPDLRRTMSSQVGSISIHNQEFWTRQNQPNASAAAAAAAAAVAADFNNNISTDNKSSNIQPKEVPLQLDNISGELRDYVDNTTCAICTDLFEDPRILPCGHTFCFECIEALITAQKNVNISTTGQRPQDICCPVCRASLFQMNDAKKLTKNFTVKSLVETVRVSAKNKASEKATNSLANELATTNLQTKTRIKDLQKHTVVMGRKFKVPQRITGVAQIGKKIYVITEGSNKLLIFEKNSKKPDAEILMQGVSQPKDIAGSEKLDFLLVVDSGSCAICRVFVSGSKKDDINVFVAGINEPFNIYLSNATKMVTKLDRKERVLCTYEANPVKTKCVKKINLPSSLKHCTHAVQTPNRDFYVSHGLLGEEGGCSISKLDNAGNILLTLNKDFTFAGPFFYMALTAGGEIVASEGCLKSLLKFDPSLNTAKLVWKLKEGLAPWKINFHEKTIAVAYESECIQTFEI